MRRDLDVDVVVVGAGPAGSATAAALAEAGHSVRVLERSVFPRDKACGDGLTPASMRELTSLGLAPAMAGYAPVRGTNLILDGTGGTHHAPIAYPGRIVPRAEFDLLLSLRAAALGAVVQHDAKVTGLMRDADGRVSGVTYQCGAVSRTLTCRFVVAADGATSAIARTSGLSRRGDRMGFAVRAYMDHVPGAGDDFHVFIPLRDPATGCTLAGYGWVFPEANDAANIGVGILRTRPEDKDVNLRTVFNQFCASLVARQPQWRGMVQRGPLSGAPLPCDFDADRVAAGGVVLVGDAARLVDPLSGEGIDTALESGALAAHAISEALNCGAEDVPGYGAELERRFGQRMRAAWSLVNNREFVWGVTSDTATVDRPLYQAVRNSIFSYQRPSRPPEDLATGVDQWLASHGLRERVAAVEQALETLAADELPMLAAAVGALKNCADQRVRTALFLLCTGAVPPARESGNGLHQLSVATELACLALAAHEDVLDTAADGHASTRSANRFAVSVGDFLLFRSFELSAQVGAGYVELMSRASADVCAGTLLGLHRGTNDADDVALLRTGTLFELPALLGSRWAGSTDSFTAAAAGVGRALGLVTAAAGSWRCGPAAGPVPPPRWDRASRALSDACAGLPPDVFGRSLRALADAYRGDLLMSSEDSAEAMLTASPSS